MKHASKEMHYAKHTVGLWSLSPLSSGPDDLEAQRIWGVDKWGGKICRGNLNTLVFMSKTKLKTEYETANLYIY